MRHWIRSYYFLLKWNVLAIKSDLPFIFIIQCMLSMGVVIGFSFIIPEVTPDVALYLTTGSMAVSLITVGLVVAPGRQANLKQQGVLDYQRSLPVPRFALLASDATVWILISIPGFFLAFLVASYRFGLEVTMSPLLAPAMLLVIVGTVTIGYSIAYLLRPTLVNMVTNLIIIGALMFAPINYPAERLPDWLAAVHSFLPLQYMAQAIRETIDVPATGVSWLPFAVLLVWGMFGLLVASRVLTRRS